MKTVLEQIEQSWGFSDENIENLKTSLSKDNLIDLQNIVNLVIDYTEQAIKADRENVANHAEITYEGEKTWDFISVDKDSIINAPQIDLK